MLLIRVGTDGKKNDISIHPGVVDGRRIHKLVTSTKPPHGGRYLRRHTDNLDRRQRAHKATLASLPSNVPPEAFRKPGSMQGNRAR